MAKMYVGMEKTKQSSSSCEPVVAPQPIVKIEEKIVYVDREVIKEVVKEIQVPFETIKEVEKVIHVPKIVFQDREVPKYIDKVQIQKVEVQVPVEKKFVPSWVWVLLGIETLAILYFLAK